MLTDRLQKDYERERSAQTNVDCQFHLLLPPSRLSAYLGRLSRLLPIAEKPWNRRFLLFMKRALIRKFYIDLPNFVIIKSDIAMLLSLSLSLSLFSFFREH